MNPVALKARAGYSNWEIRQKTQKGREGVLDDEDLEGRMMGVNLS